MKIIIDVMGGDNAPSAPINGALDAQKEFGVDLILVGDQTAIEACLKERNAVADGEKIKIVHTTEVVEICDDPTLAVRNKKDSSMTVALKMLESGEGDATISAGSTGALLTGATLIAKRIRGVRRAALAPVVPTSGKGLLLIDAGSNAECTTEYLLQFAFMGSFYAKKIMGIENPRVAQLNIGSEPTKGTADKIEAYQVLKEASDAGHFNFVGNIEGHEAILGGCDVLVADGFSGNVFLKTLEGTAKFMMKELKSAFLSGTKAKIGALLIKDSLNPMRAKMNADEVGGTALLGLKKAVIKAHGNSNARAFRSAIKQAIVFVEGDVASEIEKNAEFMTIKKVK